MNGSDFTGSSLVVAVAQLFSTVVKGSVTTLAVIGQIGAIWVATLVPWSIIPIAAICNINVFELVRRIFIPVLTGIIATTIVAMFLI